MKKIGMPMSRTDLDAPLAEHFGKAKWLLLVGEAEQCEFVRNTGLNGRWVSEELRARGCTDVVALHMGEGAYRHVMEAGLRAWEGEAGVSARTLAERLARGRLKPLAPGAGAHGGGHAHPGHAC